MKPLTVDQFLSEGCGRCALGGTPQCKVHRWEKELKQLRSLVLETGLEETVKWGMPCYTYKKHNILMIAAFKEYCSLSFFKGALLQDAEHILSSPGENSQSFRQFRFTDVKELLQHKNVLKAYIFEAIEAEKSGLKIERKALSEHDIPEEFQQAMKKSAKLKNAFYALTPGRQRAYLLFFSAAKQSKTRISRIEKCTPMILQGKGLQD